MASKKKAEAGPARRVAWHVASDITWIAIYRALMLAAISLVITMVGWQSSRIITRQDETGTEIAMLRTEVSILRDQVPALAADIIKGEMRMSRANDRQTEMSNALAVLEARVEDLRTARVR